MARLGFTIACLLGAAVFVGAPSATAQLGPMLESPGQRRPELPNFEPPPREQGSVLPEVELPERPGTAGLSAGVAAFVEEVRVRGYSVLSDQEVRDIVAPYVGRELSYPELTQLRDALTLAYVNRGYVSSGAVIPAQRLDDGVLDVLIVEGTLEGVDIETDGRLRQSVLDARLESAAEGPVNIYTLEEALQLLQQDPLIQKVEARLAAGEQPGTSRLRVVVVEDKPYWVFLEGSNHQSPSIGEWRGEIRAGHRNLTGFGDQLQMGFRGTSGLRDFEAQYVVPLNRYGSRFEVLVKPAFSSVTEAPFDQLDIENQTQTYGLTLRQPLHRSLGTQVEVFATGQWRRSESSLLGQGFAFVPGPDDTGVSTISVLRLGGEWVYRDRRQVFAIRSTASIGLAILGATINDDKVPDGEFFHWLGQAQWARRLDFLDSQLIVRGDLQASDRPLLGLEQFSIGGFSTVRGYRENTLVSDNGLIGSLEWRVPVWTTRSGVPVVELSPFLDLGYAWQTQRSLRGPSTLLSSGLGLRWRITDWAEFSAEWGYRIKDIPDVGEWNFQQEGLHVGLSVRWP